MKLITHCCYECGVTANVVTCLVKYHQPPKKVHFDVSTYHVGKCGCCNKEKEITEVKDFFYPNFALLKGTISAYKKLQKNEKQKHTGGRGLS